MKIKYLGHQGWNISIKSINVVLDLIGSTMGNGLITVNTSPKRELSEDIIKNATVFIISHEHADHFDIDFLQIIYSINSDATFLIPNLSSESLKLLLEGIGFNVSIYGSYDDITIGDIQITALPCLYSRYEPDVYALMFKDKNNGNVFFTAVDAVPTDESLSFVKENTLNLRLDNFTNNYVCRPLNQHYCGIELNKRESVENMTKLFHKFVKNMKSSHVVISGLGWKYDDDNMNKSMFHVHHNEIKLPENHKAELWIASYPEEYLLNDNSIKCINPQEYKIDGREYSYEIARDFKFELEYSELSKEKLDSLFSWVVSDFSKIVSLGCKKLNKAMHYLLMEGADNLFCFGVYDKGNLYTFSYDFPQSKFRLIGVKSNIEDVRDIYIMGVLINSTHLYGLMECSEEGHICFEVASMTWNKRRDLLPEYSDVDIGNILHPRYRQAEYTHYYLSQLIKKEPHCE